MADFDKRNEIESLDKQDMLSKLMRFPDQIRSAIAIGEAFVPRDGFGKGLQNIVVAGMGGSAIGGDLTRSYLSTGLKIPMLTHRDYSLPGFVNEDSLVIVVSYSGGTEETLSAYHEAMGKNARVVVISSGGEISQKARGDGIPLIAIPAGFMPRAALGYLFFPLLMLLGKIGLCAISPEELAGVADFLEGRVPTLSPDVGEGGNEAKSMAKRFFGRVPIIYSAREHFDAVSLRFKGQLCENSKILAFNNVFPELNHNEFVGFEHLNVEKDKLIVVLIRDREDHPRTQMRMSIIEKMLVEKGIEALKIESAGQSLLERIFSLIQLADFCSFYLAILNDCDPTPIEPIERLKRELKKGN